MKEHFVSYEQALALKELGFDQEFFGFYRKETKNLYKMYGDELYNFDDNIFFIAPLKQQVFKFFREKGYDVTIQHNKKYVAIVYSSVKNFSIDEYNTYEEAENACIDKLIQLFK
jgi:hypothetical protein